MAPRPSFFLLVVLLLVLTLAPNIQAQDSLPDRLAALDPAEPLGYKRLAEELAAKENDPASRELALRLFHIAAWLAPEELAAGSLRSMIALARSPAEEKRFRAALYLLDPTADPTLPPTNVPSVASSTAGQPPVELIQALRQWRQGNRDAARQSLAASVVRDYLAREANQSLREELQSLLAANRLTGRQLRRLLELELAWPRDAHRPAGPASQASREPWDQLGQEALTEPTTSVTLLNLTEFDPRRNVHRGGKWNRE